jgi:hypothetical protein
MTGWGYKADGIWWYGNGNIKPINWTKQFEESKERMRPTRKKSDRQLTLF